MLCNMDCGSHSGGSGGGGGGGVSCVARDGVVVVVVGVVVFVAVFVFVVAVLVATRVADVGVVVGDVMVVVVGVSIGVVVGSVVSVCVVESVGVGDGARCGRCGSNLMRSNKLRGISVHIFRAIALPMTSLSLSRKPSFALGGCFRRLCRRRRGRQRGFDDSLHGMSGRVRHNCDGWYVTSDRARGGGAADFERDAH